MDWCRTTKKIAPISIDESIQGEQTLKILILQVIIAIIVSLPLCSVCLAQDYIDKYLPDDAIARFGKGFAFDFAYSPDGKQIAVASTIGVWLYDTQTKLEKNFLTGHKGYVKEIVFNPNGETFVSIGGGVLNSPYDPAEAKTMEFEI